MNVDKHAYSGEREEYDEYREDGLIRERKEAVRIRRMNRRELYRSFLGVLIFFNIVLILCCSDIEYRDMWYVYEYAGEKM
jgi:hypothetical protein